MGRSYDCVVLLVFLAILFFLFRCQFGGDLAVESGEVGFELFQPILFAPLFGNDGFELGNVGFESGFTRFRASLICCQALLYAVDNILVVHEELFENVVDYIADVTRRALFRQEHKAYCLNKLRFYADFRETTAELARVAFTEIDFPKTSLVGMVDIGVVSHKNGFKW